jgi:type IV secretion system protein VirD4
VLSLFFQQAIGLQTRELPERNARLQCQVMMLLDEFTALGRIPIIAEAISYLPGYNVRVVLVIQTPAQLRDVYGPNGAETMLKSLGARIVFAPKDFNDAREISDELGYTTVRVKSWSKPVADWLNAKGKRGRSVNVSEQRRALLLPQEVKELAGDEAIVFYEGLRPIRCRKLRYFKDARFTHRVLPPPVIAARQSETPRIPPAPSSAAAAPPAERITREATLADIDRLDSLTLDDFAADFDQISLPPEGFLTEDDLKNAAEQFLSALQGDSRGSLA